MKLFEEYHLGKLTLKNRIVLAPMGHTSDQTCSFNWNDVEYFSERAKGGAGLILTGAVSATDEFEPAACQLLNSNKHVYMLHMIAERVHMYGAKFGIQLSPGIGRMNWIDPHTPPYSASPCPNYYNPDLICRELPTEAVKKLVKAMGESAKLAQDAGVDMIEIHAYGGYLIDQFTSAKWNHRTDEYGGSFENRQRFLFEIIDEVKNMCGTKFPIAVKITLDSVDDDEKPLEEGLAIVKRLVDHGIDLIHIGRGSYTSRWRMVGSVYQTPGFDVEAASKIREVIGDVPLMIHGKLNHHDVAEQAVKDGMIDLIAIGHGLIADPHWPNKVKNGEFDEIVPCIGCGECHFNAMKGHARPCAVNPLCMHERDFQLTKATQAKHVLIIGGGPAGLKAAITSAQRGFQTTLWEKQAYLGGALAAAAAMKFKTDVKDQVQYLIKKVYQSGVEVCLQQEATLSNIKEANPDVVMIATGATAKIPPINGIDKPNIMTAVPALMNQKQVKDRVVIIGGGEVGCEMACEFSTQGKSVTLLEVETNILTAPSFVANKQNLLYLLKNSHVEVITSVKTKKVETDCIIIEKEGVETSLPYETLILSTGFESNHDLYDEVTRAGYQTIQIGDACTPGKVIDAIHQGYHSVRILE